ncbi:MAG: 16S rRNA (adenine(1518)-N(6)/adenine(1519)-N(6))-dimethyltransferase RsmA [Candidatus Binatia bacterium]
MSTHVPRKRFGQHFLVQPAIAERIVSLAELTGEEVVLEIGPGRGALTRLLAARSRRLLLVEVDRDLAAALRAEFAAAPGVEVHEADVLRLELASWLGAAAPLVAVANLPYNISTPVLMQLLGAPALFSRLVLMLQREVAERLCAAPGSKAYGALSVVVQAAADVRVALHVPATAFAPRPQVESAVVVVRPHQPPLRSAAQQRELRAVVRCAFSRRRKQLANALAPLTADPHELLQQLGFDPRRRPETLAPADFMRLADALQGDARRRRPHAPDEPSSADPPSTRR